MGVRLSFKHWNFTNEFNTYMYTLRKAMSYNISHQTKNEDFNKILLAFPFCMHSKTKYAGMQSQLLFWSRLD
jgi:hypothetical protein